MKHKKKLITLFDIINELRIKKKFLGFSFLISLFVVFVIGYYKSNIALPSLNIQLQEQYFPISKEMKENIRLKMVNIFTDKNELLNFVKDKKLKRKILNNDLTFNFKIDSKNFGKSVVNVFQVNVMLKTDKQEDYKIVSDRIKNLVLIIEKKIRDQIHDKIDSQISHRIKTINIAKKNDLETSYLLPTYLEIRDLENQVSIIKNDKMNFFIVYPSEPKFSKNTLSTKQSILICLLFMAGSISIVVLNRFIL